MFGLSTTLIAIIAVVVLLILLGVLVFLNARQKKAKSLAARGPRRGGAKRGAVDATSAAQQPDDSLDWESEPTAEPAEETAAELPSTTATTAPALPATPLSRLQDPVAYLLTSLLDGQGDLTEAELRRLELYRPARVIAVAEELKTQVTGKGRDLKLLRLARAKLYAETLTARAEEKKAASSGPSALDSTGPPAQPPKDEGLSLDHELSLLPPLEEAATVAAVAPAPFAPTPAPTSASVAPETATAVPALGPATAAGAMTSAFAWDAPVQSAPAASPAIPPAGQTAPVAEKAAALGQSVPAAAAPQAFAWDDWSPEEEPALEEIEVEETSLEFESPTQTTVAREEAGAVAPAADALIALTGARGVARAPAAAGPTPGTAEHLLSLPVGERADALDGLSPAEISRVISQSPDQDLKLAAIASLEATGSADALFALKTCLDNTDPEVQVCALDAAERLLAKQ